MGMAGFQYHFIHKTSLEAAFWPVILATPFSKSPFLKMLPLNTNTTKNLAAKSPGKCYMPGRMPLGDLQCMTSSKPLRNSLIKTPFSFVQVSISETCLTMIQVGPRSQGSSEDPGKWPPYVIQEQFYNNRAVPLWCPTALNVVLTAPHHTKKSAGGT